MLTNWSALDDEPLDDEPTSADEPTDESESEADESTETDEPTDESDEPEADESTETDEPTDESDESEAGEPTEADEADEDDALPPPPSRPVPPAPLKSPVQPLPQGWVPLPVLPVGDDRIPADAETLAEAAICAAVFRRLAEHAEAHVAHILASDEDMPPFYLDDEDRDLLAALFAKDTALAARIRLAAGSIPRKVG